MADEACKDFVIDTGAEVSQFTKTTSRNLIRKLEKM